MVLVVALCLIAITVLIGVSHRVNDTVGPSGPVMVQERLRWLYVTLSIYQQRHGCFPPYEGVALVRELDIEFELSSWLDMRCPWDIQSKKVASRWSLGYAGPSRRLLRDLKEGDDAIVFAVAEDGDWDPPEFTLYAIRFDGTFITIARGDWDLSTVEGAPMPTELIGPNSPLSGLQGLRR